MGHFFCLELQWYHPCLTSGHSSMSSAEPRTRLESSCSPGVINLLDAYGHIWSYTSCGNYEIGIVGRNWKKVARWLWVEQERRWLLASMSWLILASVRALSRYLSNSIMNPTTTSPCLRKSKETDLFSCRSAIQDLSHPPFIIHSSTIHQPFINLFINQSSTAFPKENAHSGVFPKEFS